MLAFPGSNGLAIWDGETQTSHDLPVNLSVINQIAWDAAGERLALDHQAGSMYRVLVVSLAGQEPISLYEAGGLMDVPRLAGRSPQGRWLAL
jgi:hypothetical protein